MVYHSNKTMLIVCLEIPEAVQWRPANSLLHVVRFNKIFSNKLSKDI